MPLASGAKLGPYEILALIGEGGMGEVYRARDTRLNRDVAVKVSKDQFSERFEREARAVAALNHPNICHLYDVGPNFLVMEFVEGEALAGPLPLDTALNYARQIVEAIEAAHEKGIVHRDLKPANIKVTPDGKIKVLDFGLAKALEEDLPSKPAQDSPTLSMAMTRAGMILGTAAYMSPEQAKGRPADRRADIWAFGVVLFEMLVGQQTFTGETAAETLASVLKENITFDRLPQDTPPAVRKLLERCLHRDVKLRLQAIGEARIILDGPVGQVPDLPVEQAVVVPHKQKHWIPWSIAALLFLGLAASLYWIFKPSPPPAITRFPIALAEGQTYTNTGRSNLAISPDGTQIVYVANNRLYLRSMAELEARPIPGTDPGSGVTNPVFSPDGKSLVFFSTGDQTIKRIAVSGGAAVTICASSNPIGIDWSDEGIVFSQANKGILRVSPNGGQPAPLVTQKADVLDVAPQLLPGGQAVLFTSGTPAAFAGPSTDKTQIVVQNLKSGARKVVIEGGGAAHYLPTGHLVYALNGVLLAVPFDLKRLEVTGGPVGIVEGVARPNGGIAQFAFSNTGSLIYIPGPASAAGTGQNVLGLVDRKGEIEPLKIPAGNYSSPRVSRDGKRVAYQVQVDEGKDASIWIYELSGATAPRRLTIAGTGGNRYPIWSSDGERVAFQSDREGDLAIWWQRADGSGAAERLTKPDKDVAHIPESWSPDGQVFSFTEQKSGGASVWTYSLRDKKATLFAETPGSILARSVFSPDGHWIAYQLSAQPNSRIYVRPFPPTAAVYVAPEDRDTHHPLWSPDQKELFYVAGPSQFGSMSVNTKPSVNFGSPVRAPRAGFVTQTGANVRSFDILPDGKRFIGVVPAGQPQQSGSGGPQIQVVLNWFEDVKQRAPAK